jgi:hypothetical protein
MPTQVLFNVRLTRLAQDNTRSAAIQLVAKANKLDLEIVQTETGSAAPASYLKYNKLGLIPTFVGSDGYVLSEAIAIAIYGRSSVDSARSHDEITQIQLSLTERSC